MNGNDEQILKITKYTNENGEMIDPKLFDTRAEAIAKKFVQQSDEEKKQGVSITQLRRYFDEVKRFAPIVKTNDDWKVQEPYIRMLKSKLKYGIARKKNDKNATYYDNLDLFLSSGIDAMKTKKDFETFLNLFEAVYGFYYAMAPKENK